MPDLSPEDEWAWSFPVLLEVEGHLFGFDRNKKGEINSNNVLPYFYASPFFDPTCNNLALINQLNHPDTQYILHSRHLFEEALRRDFQVGFHYVVASEPEEQGQPWIIQRQRRYHNEHSQNREVVTVVEATYYTVGTSIKMSPSLLDLLRARILNVTHHIEKTFEIATELTHWSPSTGHTYTPANLATDKTTAERSSSRAGSVGSSELEASQLSSLAAKQSATESQTTGFHDNFFVSSLSLTNQFKDEYMDENPIKGEPGSFVYTSTKEQIEARNRAQAAAQITAPSLSVPVKPEMESAVSSVAPTPKPLPTEAISRKGSVVGMPPKPKRRKSKGLASPTTPSGGGT